MTRADLKHYGMKPDAREELNRSASEGRLEPRHSIMCLEGMGSRSHDLEIIMVIFKCNFTGERIALSIKIKKTTTTV